MSFDPSQIKSIKNFEMYQYWDAKRGDRLMPARADLDPADLRNLLPNILIHEVQLEPLDFRYRLIGSEIVRHLTENPTGRWMSSIPHQKKPSRLWSYLEKAVTEKAPVIANPPYIGRYKAHKSIEDVILPLSIDGVKVNMLFICVDFLSNKQ
ncbi:PAS domain-containing protein [Kiloniella laminariae]|uniref:PAS domain-containing protein n=1 Tax=Kiloniella laminariae TaxID=454162 RepID=A0ABT4LN49_9PROT|nr:PAS domain-containing protein [Kiloniella laminariae]MCZ4281761.1 PAS domain-containing protein [Kiloniella laminariae]